MTSIGQILADARRRRKATIKDAEKAIKIRAKYISALERDAFDQIVGEAYVIGFLKTYAQWLGVDPSPLIGAYRERASLAGKPGHGTADYDDSLTKGRFKNRAIRSAPVIAVVLALAITAVMILMIVIPAIGSGR